MSAIAREFDCTPSAISYIVRKAEAEAGAGAEAGSTPVEGSEAAPASPPPAAAPPASPPAISAPMTSPATTSAPPVSAPRSASTITTLSLPDRGSSQPRVSAGFTTSPPPPAPAPAPAPVASAPVAPAASTPEAPRAAGEAGSTKPGQPPPVDAVEARLRETARGCLVAYRGWRQAPGETSTQSLNDAVHELRKVLARIEIDMSASRREEQGLRPIPVPAHRAARQQQQRG